MKGFLAGIGLGTAIGIWLAPESGQETRKKLMARGAELANRFEKQSNAGGDRENPQQQSEQRGQQSERDKNSMERALRPKPAMKVRKHSPPRTRWLKS